VKAGFTVSLLLYAATCFTLPASFAAEPAFKMETISAKNFLAIRAALPEFERQGLNIENYRITVLELPQSPALLTVLFHDPSIPLGKTVGSPGLRPDFSVEMDKNNFRIVRSYFNR
jgi:hypothetical protein